MTFYDLPSRRAGRGSHVGAFAGGFMKGMLQAMQLRMQMERYDKMEKFWDWWMAKANSKGTSNFQSAINEGFNKPLPTDEGGVGGAASASGSFEHALVNIESGGSNQVSKTDVDSSGRTVAQGGNPNEISQGYFQIQNHPGGTWDTYAKAAGVDTKQYPTPMSAPYDVQKKVAMSIPYNQWGARTREQLSNYVSPHDPRTLGQIIGATSPAGKEDIQQAAVKTPSGGYVARTDTGKAQPVDAQGRAIDPKTGKPTTSTPVKAADIPTRTATAEEAATPTQGDKFVLPGGPVPATPSYSATIPGSGVTPAQAPPGYKPPPAMPARPVTPTPAPTSDQFQIGGPELAAAQAHSVTPPIGGGAGNVMEAPRGTPAANVPTPAATPVSSSVAPVTPASNQPAIPAQYSGFDARGPYGGRAGRNPELITDANWKGPMGNWGENPPLVERQQAQMSTQSAPLQINPNQQTAIADQAADAFQYGGQVGGTTAIANTPAIRVANTPGAMTSMGAPASPLAMTYDDGGDVSPAPLGMLPGMGGAQQQIPPIYYNPATYSAAGAPVGKGVTATSAPTYVGGAIPSLPMARGGVVGFDDGGDVVQPMNSDYDAMQINNMIMGDARGQGGGGGGDQSFNYTLPPEGGGPAQVDTRGSGMPTGHPPGMRLPMRGNPLGRGSQGIAAPQEGEQQDGAPQGNFAPWSPQMSDNQGNPSPNLISAISDGLHFIGSKLGLVPGQQQAIAGDPNINLMRRGFNAGVGAASPEDMKTLSNVMGFQGLDYRLHSIAALESGYNYALQTGNEKQAAQLAASIMQYSVQTSMQYGKEAYQRFAQHDTQGAVDALVEAKNQIADGTLANARVVKDANGQEMIEVSGHKLNGEELWATTIGPQQLLGAIHGAANGSLAWGAYERAAGKYDPAYAEKMRIHNEARKADAAQQKADAETAAAGNVFTPDEQQTPAITPASNQPSPAQAQPSAPSATPASVTAQAPPASQPDAVQPSRGAPLDTTGTAATAAPPQTADRGGTPPPLGHGAIPSTPNVANVPTPQAQNVDQWYADQHSQLVNSVNSQYYGPGGIIHLDSGTYRPPTNQPKGSQAWTVYNQAAARAQTQAREQITAGEKSINDQAVEMRRQQGNLQQESMIDKRAAIQSQRDLAREQAGEAQKEKFERERWQHEANAPAGYKDVDEEFRTKQPVDYLADAIKPPQDPSAPTDPTARQALGSMFNFNDPNGSMGRVNALGYALHNARTYNPRVGIGQLADTIVGMANNSHGFRGRQVNTDYGPMMQVQVFVGSKVGEGAPMEIVMPTQDYERIVGIQKMAQQTTAQQPMQRGAIPSTPSIARPHAGPGAVLPGAAITARPPQLWNPNPPAVPRGGYRSNVQ